MLARAVLLPKVDCVQNMAQVRPIAILRVLYRLVGKIAFQAVSRFLPLNISGGLPNRGVKDLAFLQKTSIEQVQLKGGDIGGMSIDLKRAFNTFPRFPFIRILERLGVPTWFTHFWILCLSRMQRCAQS